PAEQLAILARLPVPRLASSARVHTQADGDPVASYAEGDEPAAHTLRLLLGARGRSRGVLVLGRGATRGPFLPHEVALAEELAARAGLLLDNTELFVAAQRAVAV